MILGKPISHLSPTTVDLFPSLAQPGLKRHISCTYRKHHGTVRSTTDKSIQSIMAKNVIQFMQISLVSMHLQSL